MSLHAHSPRCTSKCPSSSPSRRAFDIWAKPRLLRAVLFAVFLMMLPLSAMMACESSEPSPSESAAGNTNSNSDAANSDADAGADAEYVPGCPGKFWVVKTEGPADCSQFSVGTWVSEALCPGSAPMPGELSNYCQISWLGSDGQLNLNQLKDHINSLKNDSGTSIELEEDCLVYAPQSVTDENIKAVLHAMAAKFLSLVGMVRLDPLNPPPLSANTRIAVIDTLPTTIDDPANATNPHGYVVTSTIKAMTRSAETDVDVADIRPYLGLPVITEEEIDETYGGHWASEGHMAKAICKAVGDWRKDLEDDFANAPKRLIINLSAGRLPDNLQANSCGDMSTSVSKSLVYLTLKHAACNGALTFAAAGNASGEGPECADGTTGLMCPAALAAQSVSAEECAEFEGEGYLGKLLVGPNQESYTELYPIDNTTLVTAVGAVDENDKPIAGTREGGLPKLVALGAFGAGGEGDALSGPMTGTSMATLPSAAATAWIWAVNPHLSASQVVEILTDSGVPLPDVAVTVPGQEGTHPNRVSLCQALGAACEQSVELGCNIPDPCGGTLPPPDPIPSLQDAIVSIFEANPDITSFDANAIDIAPSEQACGIGGAYGPAPLPSGCGVCALGTHPNDPAKTSELFVNVKSTLPDTLYKMTLRIQPETGPEQIFTFPNSTNIHAMQGTTFKVVNIPFMGPVNKAILEWMARDDLGTIRSMSEEIPVVTLP